MTLTRDSNQVSVGSSSGRIDRIVRNFSDCLIVPVGYLAISRVSSSSNGYSLHQLLLVLDPFADATKGADDNVQDGFVHIRIQQRNGRKTLTTVQGLSSEYDKKKIVRACKKVSHKSLPYGMTNDRRIISNCFVDVSRLW